MMNKKSDKKTIIILISLIIVFTGIYIFQKSYFAKSYNIGDPVDSLNGVIVYYNGNVGNISGRNLAPDGYNLGLKYQCVEFVKRYYYEHLNHKMPDSYGNAVDFFDKRLKDGENNKIRNLTQYTNPSFSKPMVNDLLIFDGTTSNKYGHVAIISNVSDKDIEIIQQNPGRTNKPRQRFKLRFKDNRWKIENDRILGWLRKE